MDRPVITAARTRRGAATSTDALVREGEAHRDGGRHRSALACFRRALLELPPAERDRDRVADLLTALGDVAFLAGRHDIAVRALSDAVTAYGRLRDPFVYLRLGQARFELGDLDGAADDLMRAWVVGRGAAELAGEDLKYRALLDERGLLG